MTVANKSEKIAVSLEHRKGNYSDNLKVNDLIYKKKCNLIFLLISLHVRSVIFIYEGQDILFVAACP